MSAPEPLGRGIKQSELRKIATCALCEKKVGHDGNILFWRVEIRRYGIRADRVRRQTGLEMMMGSPALAAIMGPDEDLAEPVMEPRQVTVCEPCALNRAAPLAILGLEE